MFGYYSLYNLRLRVHILCFLWVTKGLGKSHHELEPEDNNLVTKEGHSPDFHPHISCMPLLILTLSQSQSHYNATLSPGFSSKASPCMPGFRFIWLAHDMEDLLQNNLIIPLNKIHWNDYCSCPSCHS